MRNAALRARERLGWGIWKIWSGFHRRNLVETKMHSFKRLGEGVMARTFERQVRNCMCVGLCSTASRNLGADKVPVSGTRYGIAASGAVVISA